MNFNKDPNIRQRRRSTLGRRNKNLENLQMPPQPFLAAPAIPKTVQTGGLGRCRSAMENCFLDKTCKQLNKNTGINKRLFPTTPQINFIGSSGLQEHNAGSRETTERPTDPLSNNDTDTLLNVTGINMIATPNGETKSTNSSILEPPKSPGPSRYNQLILQELADIKPPVDKCQSSLTATNTCEMLDEHEWNTEEKYGRKKLSIIEEDCDLDSFEIAEKTICEQYRSIQEPPTMAKNKSVTFPTSKNRTESVSDDKLTQEETNELEKLLDEVNQGLEDIDEMKIHMNKMIIQMNKMSIRMRSCKTSLECLVNKRQQPNAKTNAKQLNVSKLEFADQTAIWTPQSLSSVLHEQIEELFH